ncbi:MAG: Cthe_2314 family HEPN domain-containing protein [Verrucomicrobiia bacterium]|jgi:hypothetical protein
MELSNDFLRTAFGPDKRGHIVQRRKLEPHEEYIRSVLVSAGEVVGICEQLEQAAAFLMNYRATPAAKKEGVTRYRHIIYHLEGYLVRTTTVFDRSLILANDVLRLGNPPRNCRRNVILNNSYVKGTVVAESLTLMEKAIDRFKPTRNLVSHRAGYSDAELHRLGIFYFVVQAKSAVVPKYIVNVATNRYVQSKVRELRAFCGQLNRVVALLMRALAPHLDSQYKAMTGSKVK